MKDVDPSTDKVKLVIETTFELAYLVQIDIKTLVRGTVFECRRVPRVNDFKLFDDEVSVTFNRSKTSTIMTIRGKPETKETYENYGFRIRDIFSFAFGVNCHFETVIYTFQSGQSYVEPRAAVRTYNSGYQIIPVKNIDHFVAIIKDKYFNLPDIFWKRLWILTDHLNNCRYGYLDDRLPRITQAWELFVYLSKKEKGDVKKTKEYKKLVKGLEELINEINAEVDKWAEDQDALKGLHDPKKIKEKITAKLFDIGIVNRIMLHLERLGLGDSKYRETLKIIFRYRNEAHHGGLIKESNKEKVLEQAEDSVFILQSAILKLIGYTGEVINPEISKRVRDLI